MKKILIIGLSFLLVFIASCQDNCIESSSSLTYNSNEIITTEDVVAYSYGHQMIWNITELYDDLKCDNVFDENNNKIELSSLEIDDLVSVKYVVENDKKNIIEIKIIEKAEPVQNAFVVGINGDDISLILINNDIIGYDTCVVTFTDDYQIVDMDGNSLEISDISIGNILCVRMEKQILPSSPPQIVVHKIIVM